MKVDITEALLRNVEDRVVDILARRMNENQDVMGRIESLMEETLKAHCDEVVGPILKDGIKDHVLQLTNTFGEARGGPVSFTEYIAEYAKGYLHERLNALGEVVKRGDYRWNEATPRLAVMIKEHLR